MLVSSPVMPPAASVPVDSIATTRLKSPVAFRASAITSATSAADADVETRKSAIAAPCFRFMSISTGEPLAVVEKYGRISTKPRTTNGTDDEGHTRAGVGCEGDRAAVVAAATGTGRRARG